MAAMATPALLEELGANPARLREAVADVRSALVAVVLRKDPDEADQTMAKCRGVSLPDPLAALRELVEGTIALQRGDPAAALTRFDAADRLSPGMPALKVCRAAALNLNGRPAEALDSARGYIAELGPDPLAHTHEGTALEGLGRRAEAVVAFRKALDEDPDETLALQGLRRTLPAENKAELGDRLARARKAGELFNELLNEAREAGDEAGARALIAGLRKAHPDDPRAVVEELRDLVQTAKYAEAADSLRARLAGAKPGPDQSRILNAYLFAMTAVGRAADAYAAVPAAHAGTAFRTLADSREDKIGGTGPDNPDPEVDQLKDLIAAHRKRLPADPWLWYYEAVVYQTAGNLEKAERLLAEGAAKLVGRDETERATDRDRERFRARRVQCLYTLKQGLKAYADVGPTADTFRQLANRYDGDHDAAGLAALVAVHAERSPTDPVVKFWRAEVHYLKGEYALAAVGFRSYWRAAGETEPERLQTSDKEVRCFVRMDDAAGARRAVTEVGPERVSLPLRAAVAAASGDVAELDQLLAEKAKAPGGLFLLYYDEDFVRLIAADKFAELRKKYPDPRPKKPGGPVG